MTTMILRLIAGLLLIGLAADCSRDQAERVREAPAQEGVTVPRDSIPPADKGGLATTVPDSAAGSESFDQVSNELIQWGVQATTDGGAPRIPASWLRLLDAYGAICLGDTARKEVFLTFDAGYEAGYTSGLLDVLKEEGVKAAFFISGYYVMSQPGLVGRMVAEGHTVGNHGYSHLSMPSLDVHTMRAEILAVGAKYKALTGEDMRYFRPPSGEMSARTLAVARGLGYVTVLWSLAYKDWEPLPGGPEESYQTITSRLHNGAVILLHVTSKDDAAAFERVVQAIKAAGYRFGNLREIEVMHQPR